MQQRKIALVTGATTGIGRAAADALVHKGLTVWGTGRAASAVPTENGVRPLALDVTDEESIRAATDRVLQEHGHVDVLVNNAGYGLNGFLEDLPLDAVRAQFETNVFGLLRMTQLLVPGMRAAGAGRIIHVGSVGVIITAPGAGAYHASKFAVEAIADVQRMELKRFGIDVVVVQPTGVLTPFFDKIAHTYPGTDQASPYYDAMQKHRAVTRRMHDRGTGFTLISPQRVGAVIAKEATRQRPRSRVLVGASAKVFARTRRALPDRWWDRVILSQFS